MLPLIMFVLNNKNGRLDQEMVKLTNMLYYAFESEIAIKKLLFS